MKKIFGAVAVVLLSGCVTQTDRAGGAANSARPASAGAAEPARQECVLSTEYVAKYGMAKAKAKLAECEKKNKRAAAAASKVSAKPAEPKPAAAAKPKQVCSISTEYVARYGIEQAKKALADCERRNK